MFRVRMTNQGVLNHSEVGTDIVGKKSMVPIGFYAEGRPEYNSSSE
jgi:hypothetical protein